MKIAMAHVPLDWRWYCLAIIGLVLPAWLVLAAWEASPYAYLLHHTGIGETHRSPILHLSLFVLGWSLMIVAMMAPADLPLVYHYRQLVMHRSDRHRLVAGLVAGYLCVWALFGGLAYLGDSLLHTAVERVEPLAAVSGSIAAIVILGVGIYQLTTVKDACLARCRLVHAFGELQPLTLLTSNAAWRTGLRQVCYCVGSCGGLMLFMFALGEMSLIWMLILGVVMAIERTSPWGQRLAPSLGLGMIIWGALSLLSG